MRPSLAFSRSHTDELFLSRTNGRPPLPTASRRPHRGSQQAARRQPPPRPRPPPPPEHRPRHRRRRLGTPIKSCQAPPQHRRAQGFPSTRRPAVRARRPRRAPRPLPDPRRGRLCQSLQSGWYLPRQGRPRLPCRHRCHFRRHRDAVQRLVRGLRVEEELQDTRTAHNEHRLCQEAASDCMAALQGRRQPRWDRLVDGECFPTNAVSPGRPGAPHQLLCPRTFLSLDPRRVQS